jgi:zinc transport system substrate-binding protein
MRAIVLFFLLSGILSACNNDLNDKSIKQKLNVVTTIKPIQSLVLAIAGDKVNSIQLIPNGLSPHDYHFKPSDLNNIKKANLIIQIDEHFEAFLQTALKARKKDSVLISLADAEEISQLALFSDQNHNEKKYQHHNHVNIDLHIWTSPKNTLIMAKTISSALIKVDPENTEHYRENLKLFSSEVEALSIEIKNDLRAAKNKPYIVFHNSWQHFSNFIGLKKPTIVNMQHSVSSGAKNIAKIRQQILDENIQCVFSDPGVRASQVKTLTEKRQMKTVEIDVLQSKLPLSKDTTINWFKAVSSNIATCLQ